jgi:hypothetical protein
MMTAAQPGALDDLAHRLASHGSAAVDSELPGFLAYARRRGATPLLLSILADTSQPDVVRQGAFGRITTELQQPRRTTQRCGTQPKHHVGHEPRVLAATKGWPVRWRPELLEATLRRTR